MTHHNRGPPFTEGEGKKPGGGISITTNLFTSVECV
jgi:hypothetical protein